MFNKIYNWVQRHSDLIMIFLLVLIFILLLLSEFPSFLSDFTTNFLLIYEKFSWPLLILLLVLIFRKHITKLFNKITFFKTDYFELNFEHETSIVSRYLYEVAYIEQINFGPDNLLEDRFDWYSEKYNLIDYYIESNPARAVLESFEVLSGEYISLGKEEFSLTNARDNVTFAMVVEFYYSENQDYEKREAFRKFEDIYSMIKYEKINKENVTKEQGVLFKKLMILGLLSLPPGPQSYLTMNNAVVNSFRYTKYDLSKDLYDLRINSQYSQEILDYLREFEPKIGTMTISELKNDIENHNFIKVGPEYEIIMNLIFTYLVNGEISENNFD